MFVFVFVFVFVCMCVCVCVYIYIYHLGGCLLCMLYCISCFPHCFDMYHRIHVFQILCLLETPVILIRRRAGAWMVLRRKKIGGGFQLRVKVIAAGVKRKEKLAYLAVGETAGKESVVLTLLQ